MKYLFMLLLLFFNCNLAQENEKVIGNWIGEYVIEINLDYEPINIEDFSEDDFPIEMPTDTVYSPLPNIITFLPNGEVSSFDTNIQNGKWECDSGLISISLDSEKLTGKIIDSKLELEVESESKKYIFCFQKIDNYKKSAEPKIIGETWTIKENENFYTSYQFIDSLNVLISTGSRIDSGYWKSLNKDGIYLLNILNLTTIDNSVSYFYNIKGRNGFVKAYERYGLERPRCENMTVEIIKN